jgi:uncharacterized membrane-anchored protein
MKWKNNKLFQQVIVFSIPILILIGLAIPPAWTTLTGEEIRIQTEPIDPTDLFRGSYVSLYYEIETVTLADMDSAVISEIKQKNSGDTLPVFVRLKQENNDIYTVEKVEKERPNEGIYLKGELEAPYEFEETKGIFHIRYHLDNFYAEKEEAINLEKATTIGPAVAVVKVKNGDAILTDIIIP